LVEIYFKNGESLFSRHRSKPICLITLCAFLILTLESVADEPRDECVSTVRVEAGLRPPSNGQAIPPLSPELNGIVDAALNGVRSPEDLAARIETLRSGLSPEQQKQLDTIASLMGGAPEEQIAADNGGMHSLIQELEGKGRKISWKVWLGVAGTVTGFSVLPVLLKWLLQDHPYLYLFSEKMCGIISTGIALAMIAVVMDSIQSRVKHKMMNTAPLTDFVKFMISYYEKIYWKSQIFPPLAVQGRGAVNNALQHLEIRLLVVEILEVVVRFATLPQEQFLLYVRDRAIIRIAHAAVEVRTGSPEVFPDDWRVATAGRVGIPPYLQNQDTYEKVLQLVFKMDVSLSKCADPERDCVDGVEQYRRLLGHWFFSMPQPDNDSGLFSANGSSKH
jgi:hypothetical protein